MKFKLFMVVFLAVICVSAVSAAIYTPQEGTFAYKEVQEYTLSGFNFTMLNSYDIVFHDETHMSFRGNNNTLNITVSDNGTIDEINSTEGSDASKTMLGPVEGYLVDRNGDYTFSFIEDNSLVTLSSNDLSLMIGVIGED